MRHATQKSLLRLITLSAALIFTVFAEGCSPGRLINPGNMMTPAVVNIVPNQGPLVGGTQIAILGSGFVSGGSVRIGSADCNQIHWISSNEIHCVTPEGSMGPADVSVFNPNQKNSALPKGYDYTENVAALPEYALVTGGSVKISGTHRKAIVTVGEMGGTMIQSGTLHKAVTGVQATLSAGPRGH